jgi:hypothetical protein
MEKKALKNSKLLTGPLTYVTRDNDDILNVDTSLGPVTIVLPNIKNSGYMLRPKSFYINDVGGQASVNNIRVEATGGDEINTNSFVIIDKDRGSGSININSQTEWLLTGDGVSQASGDANYVHTQGAPIMVWNVLHGLNKRCAINVVDSGGESIKGLIKYINDNQVNIEFNKPRTGYVYCN